MPSILLTPPAAEPLSLAEAKDFLRVETADEDPLIAAFISAARLHVEAQTGLALVTQNWRMVLDCWPANGRIAVRPAPLQALTAARVFDFDGETRAVDLQAFVSDASTSTLSFIPMSISWALPMPTRIAAGIEIDFSAGFGDAASDVPEPLRQAIRLLVAHWHENRAIVAGAEVAPVPANAAALMAPYRRLAL